MSQPIFKDGLGYEGKVTLTLKSAGRILESKTYKNSGTAKLFEFLGNCFIDDFIAARRLLPSKIMLLNNKADVPDSKNANVSEMLEQRSSFQGLSQQPTLITNTANQVSVIYSFEVPQTAIIGTFNQVALYATEVTVDYLNDFSAYYFLTDGAGNFSPQSTIDWTPSTVLLIEWELVISNKNEVLNNNSLEDIA